jgi:uroporphyrinogen decarboxylase
MNLKENFLEAIRFGKPDHVPNGSEDMTFGIELSGNFKVSDWTDLWGVRWEVGLKDTVPFPKGNPLLSLDMIDSYNPPSPAQLVLTEETKTALSKVDRSTKLVSGHLMYLLFERAWAIMGMDNFMVAFHTHPKEMHVFLRMISSYAKGVFDRYMELGVDAVSFSEDLGSQRALMISPEMFREFILPEYKYCFSELIKNKKIINFHSCGCVESVAKDLADIGVTILNPIQLRANDIKKIKSDTKGKMALYGAIDTAVLANGTADDVRKLVIYVMDILKPGGGYICGPDQGIPGIPQENMDMLWKTATEFGKY